MNPDYTQLGYDISLTRSDNLISNTQELDPLAFESFAPEISGSKLTGFVKSQDGRLQLNLDENYLVITDGVVERIRLGKLADGSYGLLIKDNNAKNLMQVGDINFIQSIGEVFKLDFEEEQILIKDQGGRVVLLLGKQVGGF